MRLSLIASFLALAACTPAPRSTVEVMPEVAAEYAALYNDWDEARYLALFPEGKAWSIRGAREHFAWLHDQLGACGEPTLMWTTDKRGARWTHACERGALETWFRLDETGHVVELSAGASAVPPPPALLAAAEVVLASLPWAWDSERPFEHNLNKASTMSLGRCTLVRPWVFGAVQGLFHARCDQGGERTLLIDISRKNGTISRAWMMPADFYKGPPVTDPA